MDLQSLILVISLFTIEIYILVKYAILMHITAIARHSSTKVRCKNCENHPDSFEEEVEMVEVNNGLCKTCLDKAKRNLINKDKL